ncbi:Rhamnan synthesis F family protein [Aromatoleum bremense]|nr:rhamnan synthesis F family protein [Aromatoleum bremense]QTQ32635.1 Rhamnan synthesis F family protein [Aromatoleum bremense]
MSMMISRTVLQRRLRSVGRAVYWRLPPGWRESVVEFSYRHAGGLFRGIGHYEIWRQQRLPGGSQNTAVGPSRLTELGNVAPLQQAPGRIAIHAHVYYPDLAKEFAARLRNMPYPYDLFVSVANEKGMGACRSAFARLPCMGRLRVEVVPNRGRDLAPMFCAFGGELKTYDFIAHIHTKKSLYNKGATDGWRDYLLSSLLGSEGCIRRIFRLLVDDAGMVFPQNYSKVPYAGSTWLANRASGVAWSHRLGVRAPSSGYFDFPIGSMFWARMDALRPLFDVGLTLEDFDAEAGQLDGTLAHTIERLLGVVARGSGRRMAILRDATTPSWSPWRFDQYLHRGRTVSEDMLAMPELKLIIFDVFDTLLVRPLLDPEQLKAVVARQAGVPLGKKISRLASGG